MTDKEYIERDALAQNQSICRSCFHSYVCEQFNEHRDSDNKKCHFYHDHFVSAADVQDILRCKDCRYSDFQYQEKGKGEEATPVCVCYYLNRHVRADDYCSFVAKMDGKGDA